MSFSFSKLHNIHTQYICISPCFDPFNNLAFHVSHEHCVKTGFVNTSLTFSIKYEKIVDRIFVSG